MNSTIFLGSSENVSDVLRVSAKQQLDSYADEWIIIFEALQNALDAVENQTGGFVQAKLLKQQITDSPRSANSP